MTTPVQTVQSTQVSAATSCPCTITASLGGPLIVLCPVGMSGSAVSWAVTDNRGNTYVKRADTGGSAGGGFVEAMIWDCLSPGTGVTTITLTPTGKTANGTITVVEMPAGSILGFDQAGFHGQTTPADGPIVVTASAPDTNAGDFVFACMCEQGNGVGDNPTDPPSGFTHLSVTTNGNTLANEWCWRTNSGIVTDSASWTWSNGPTNAAAAIVSYVPAGGGPAAQVSSLSSMNLGPG